MSDWTPPLGRDGRFSMTPRQQAIYRAIAAEHAATGQRSFRLCEIVTLTGIRRSNLHGLLADLVESGWLVRDGAHYVLDAPVMQFRAHTERAAA